MVASPEENHQCQCQDFVCFVSNICYSATPQSSSGVSLLGEMHPKKWKNVHKFLQFGPDAPVACPAWSLAWEVPPPVDNCCHVVIDNDETELDDEHMKNMMHHTSDITLTHVPHLEELPPPCPSPLNLPFPHSLTTAWVADTGNDDHI